MERVDLDKCREAQIAVIADSEIDDYASLGQHLKHAARYQFLGHMFEGQKIDGLATQVVATCGKMGGETFYTFLIRPDDLLKIAYVGHKASRDIESLETYQRMLQPKRLIKIAEYINSGGKFPTNIVLNLKTAKRSGLRFDVKEKIGEETFGVLHLPANYASAWVIDGQHRLYGYAHARQGKGFAEDKTTIPVLAYENLSAHKEMDLFIDINSKQVKVSTGLLVELYSDLHRAQAILRKRFRPYCREYLHASTPRKLPRSMTGWLSPAKKTSYRCLTQTSIRDGLEVAKVVAWHFQQGRSRPRPALDGKGRCIRCKP
ncbi:DGQHR domain-containing protein [Rhizobium yanglingense]